MALSRINQARNLWWRASKTSLWKTIRWLAFDRGTRMKDSSQPKLNRCRMEMYRLPIEAFHVRSDRGVSTIRRPLFKHCSGPLGRLDYSWSRSSICCRSTLSFERVIIEIDTDRLSTWRGLLHFTSSKSEFIRPSLHYGDIVRAAWIGTFLWNFLVLLCVP